MSIIAISEHGGLRREVHAEVGQVVMQAVTFASVLNVPGDCASRHSHTYVDETWAACLAPSADTGHDMLENIVKRRCNSRRTCQLVIGAGRGGFTQYLLAA